MVTSVSSSSSILTLFQTGKETGTDANSETLAKIQELAKEAEQMKAGSSPARVQGASVATEAWINASTPLGASTVEKIHAIAQRTLEVLENPQVSDRTAQGLSQSDFNDRYRRTITSLGSLVGEIAKYNSSLSHLENFKEELESNIEIFDKFNSGKFGDSFDVFRDISKYIIETSQNDLFSTLARINEFPDMFEKAIEYLKENYIVDGEIATKDENGRYKLGAFTISWSDDYMLFKSDGNGTLLGNSTEVRGKDVWTEMFKGDERIWNK